MMRLHFIVACILIAGGCRSQNGPFGTYGTRVPPPATGSYGSANTYYQNSAPRTSTAPATTPRTANPSLGAWKSVSDDSGSSNSPATIADQAITGSSVRAASAVTSTVRAPTTKSASTQLRLNGMPVNEAKAVTPASFESPIPASEANTDDNSAVPTKPSTNTLRSSSAAVNSDAWQTRSAPSPTRVAGN